MCLIDDAQWLDAISAQTLGFVARRQMADPVALVFAVRGVREDRELAQLPNMVVRGLKDADARALLDTVLAGDVDNRVRETIVAETGGNPLALLELPRGLSTAELTFGFGLTDAVPLEAQLEHGFTQRLGAAPWIDAPVPACRSPRAHRGRQPAATGDAAARCRLRGVGSCGGSGSDRGRCPSPVPSPVGAISRRASRRGDRPADRPPRSGRGTDPNLDPDRRAWHRSHAASGPDEAVAVDLESSADRARARGGLAAQAAFLERAIELTARPCSSSCPHPGGRKGPAPGRLVRCGPHAAGRDRGCAARRANSCRARGSPGPDSVLLQPQPGRTTASPVGRPADGGAGRSGRPRHLPRCVGGGTLGRSALAGDVGAREVAAAARSAPPSSLVQPISCWTAWRC